MITTQSCYPRPFISPAPFLRFSITFVTEIVVTGGSAGGLSTILHVDRLKVCIRGLVISSHGTPSSFPSYVLHCTQVLCAHPPGYSVLTNPRYFVLTHPGTPCSPTQVLRAHQSQVLRAHPPRYSVLSHPGTSCSLTQSLGAHLQQGTL